jgi:type II secretory pathway component PulM
MPNPAISRIKDLLARAEASLGALSPRDRTLVVGLLAVGTLTALLVGGLAMRSSLRSAESKVQARLETLQLIEALASDHAAADERAAEIAAQMKVHSGTELSAFLEQAARNAQVGDKLDAVREKSASTTGDVEEKVYAVSITRLSVPEMTRFLAEVETKGYPLRIRSFKVKTRSRADEPKQVDVSMDVSAFKIVAAAAPATPEEG